VILLPVNYSPVWWKTSSAMWPLPEEIQENDFNLNIPRYVDTLKKKPKFEGRSRSGYCCGAKRRLKNFKGSLW
jgi:hypothetical protein